MLDRIFLICCFFPFVSPYPIGSDIQPLSGIFALLIILRRCITYPKLDSSLFIILLLPIMFLGYNNFIEGSFDADLGKYISLLFGALIIVGFYFSKDKLDAPFINYVVGIYFSFTILLLLFPGPMVEIQNLLIRNTNSTEFGYRGVATLVTEPGLFGGLLVFMLLIVDNLFSEQKITSTNKYILYGMILFMLLWTKSGTGYLYFVIYLVFKFFNSNVKKHYKIGIAFFMVFSLFILFNFLSQYEAHEFGRGMEVLILLADPETLMKSDTSIMTRIVDLILSFQSIIQYPLGVGNGSVLEASKVIMLDSPFVQRFYDSTGKEFGLNSSFTYLTVAYGLFFWGYLAYLFLHFSKSNLACKFFALLYLSVSYSAAFPAIWILLTLKTITRVEEKS